MSLLHVVELEFAEQILHVPGGQVLSFPDVQEHSMCGCSGHCSVLLRDTLDTETRYF